MSFHESGAAQLEIDNDLLILLRDHLIDIKNEENTINLIFDIDINNYEINLKEYGLISLINDTNAIFMTNDNTCIENHDPVYVLKTVKQILSNSKGNVNSLEWYYENLMNSILEVSKPFSSFVEALLCNMFLVEDDENWREYKYKNIVKKLGDKTLAKKLKLLSLLYQQNKKSIEEVDKLESYIDSENLTIHEKIFLEQYSDFT